MSAREVELSGGAPWGFRMHGGVDQNQPLRISRVNPGRKASLCGVREGDVISSINGRATRGMSNADAHAMLRAAGPVLRLGLNEDREMSPRRRSISKGSELKRPSQLLTSAEEATPQEPVYATIKPPLSQTWAPSSPLRSSVNSLLALDSTPLVKSVAPLEQPLKFHPTNPFYTTLPSNYTSASKLPISNGKPSISTLDRNKTTNNPKDTYDCSPDFKSPSYYTTNDFGFSGYLNSSNNYTEKTNGYGFNTANSTANDKSNITYDKVNRDNPSLPNDNELKNPFRTNRINSDPFEKYLNPGHKLNGKFESESKNMTNSMSDNSFHKTKEITERSTVTEHKISEIEEVKTIKKIVFNGSGGQNVQQSNTMSYVNGERKRFGLPEPEASKEYYQNSSLQSTRNEQSPTTPTQSRNDNLRANNQGEPQSASSTKYHFVQLNHDVAEGSPASEPLTAKPPATPAPAPSPTAKQISSSSKRGTINEPSSLKDLCVRKVATFPYGDKILEELASVSKRLQNITIYGQNSSRHYRSNAVGPQIVPQAQQEENMPYYPLPDVSSIEKVTLPSKNDDHNPPPVQPRNSSLKLSQDENHWVGMPTETEPVYVCLSPSQKMLMEKTNTVITKEDASQLVDMHKKYVDRRGYNEYYDKEFRKENQRPDNPPVVPFKSQTGSRLLALIRDPAVTDNINSIKSRNQLKILNQIESIDKKCQKISLKKNEHYSSAKDFSSSLKPVPPPRTRKFSSSIYESDESSDFTDSSFRSIKNERKSFHYSTGNLSKEIENDISSIQNMHRYYTDVRDQYKDQSAPRRPSLPKDLCDQQMEYIRRKEKEVEAEILRLENEKLSFPVQQKQGPRAPFISESRVFNEQITRTSSQSMLLKRDSELKLSVLKSPKLPEKPDKGKLSVFSSSQEELLREKMYSEYVSQMAEREERRQQKVIKITNNNKPVATENPFSKSMPALDFLDSKVNNRIEKEFIWKARERWNKLGIKDPETEDEIDENKKDVYKEPKVIEHKIKVIEGGEEKDVKKLPSHLQDFVRFTVKDTDQGKSSPGESSTGPASPHVMILCAVIILVLAVSKMFWRMLRNK